MQSSYDAGSIVVTIFMSLLAMRPRASEQQDARQLTHAGLLAAADGLLILELIAKVLVFLLKRGSAILLEISAPAGGQWYRYVQKQ